VPIFWAKPGRHTLTYYWHKVYMYYGSRNYSIGPTKSTLKAEKFSYPTERFAYLRGQPSDYQTYRAQGNNRMFKTFIIFCKFLGKLVAGVGAHADLIEKVFLPQRTQRSRRKLTTNSHEFSLDKVGFMVYDVSMHFKGCSG
jgi:hypothetical protein